MPAHDFVSPDSIRAQFSAAMSLMYKQEVPLYGTLLALVSEINQQVMAEQPEVTQALRWTGELERLGHERHGAIRVGTAQELATIARLFAVMGMQPVGYYDLSSAGVPVHSTAFRAVHEQSLHVSPFRVFTSLLRLELIDNLQLREMAKDILAKRQIFTPRVLHLIEQHERDGGLNAADAQAFVQQALQTFRWHHDATVTAKQYQQLHDQHRLLADVVAFRGPHINHLTPRTLDIDAIQLGMPAKGITPKAVVEGPPPRRHPILLRQTSFKALQEKVAFCGQHGSEGSHTARFGEIEQRGAALTPKGRQLYDKLLDTTRVALGGAPVEANAARYMAILTDTFAAFPDDLAQMREQGLAYFRYFATEKGLAARDKQGRPTTLQGLIDADHVHFEALVYEDFLPVSAAGIFQSNLGDDAQAEYGSNANRAAFEAALGLQVQDELALYAQSERRSLQACAQALNLVSV
ncbi:VOC family protein [Pseudomonas fulva]|uniref:2-oxoadipate dioxygenase/decarboxylase n=1 Tax=Pseudomonas fulva TaxID=47880 RepID=A0A7S9LH84_9PSED|nr:MULTISPECIES: VOC family protein [Pseudomonas]MBA1205785.1 VOC family protein [Pseudomonas fulva]MBA1214921.1 VOC family protein [Pseudomonas fulva]MCP3788498.1 VOC family protein [Pseudomonas sp. N2-11]MDH0570537.1 VOC family protein [Pseudomonas fulva]QPH43925.1 VOC family protein [Pseudomonas fulva]